MPFVRIKYFPEEATSMDVRRFFKKIEIPDGGVHVIGGPKGLVYVNLHNEEDLELALQRDGKKLSPEQGEHIYKVKVAESSEEEMKAVITEITNGCDPEKGPREVTPPPENDIFVRMSDLPDTATMDDIIPFFNGLKIAQFKKTECGSVLVKFNSVEDKQKALSYDQKFFGSKFVKVSHLECDIWEELDVDAVKPIYDNNNQEKDETKFACVSDIDSSCVKLSGLAPSVTKADLLAGPLDTCMISKYGFYLEAVSKKCTGNCFIEFVDQQTRDRAILRSNNARLYGEIISAEAIKAEDMKSQILKHRQELRTIEYNRRKTNKAKRKQDELELSEREERVEKQEDQCQQVREQLMEEMKTTTCPKKKALIKESLSKKLASPFEEAPENGFKSAGQINMNLSNEPQQESVLQRLQREKKEKEQESLKEELQKKTQEVESAKTTMNMMLMSNMATCMMMQNQSTTSKAQSAAPPATGQNNGAIPLPKEPTVQLPNNYDPNSQIYQPPPRVPLQPPQRNVQPRPTKAPRLHYQARGHHPSFNAPTPARIVPQAPIQRMPAPRQQASVNPYNQSAHDDFTNLQVEMPTPVVRDPAPETSNYQPSNNYETSPIVYQRGPRPAAKSAAPSGSQWEPVVPEAKSVYTKPPTSENVPVDAGDSGSQNYAAPYDDEILNYDLPTSFGGPIKDSGADETNAEDEMAGYDLPMSFGSTSAAFNGEIEDEDPMAYDDGGYSNQGGNSFRGGNRGSYSRGGNRGGNRGGFNSRGRGGRGGRGGYSDRGRGGYSNNRGGSYRGGSSNRGGGYQSHGAQSNNVSYGGQSNGYSNQNSNSYQENNNQGYTSRGRGGQRGGFQQRGRSWMGGNASYSNNY